MDFEKAGRFLPKTITFMLFAKLTSENEFLMNAHDVAMKMSMSWTKTEEDVNALARFVERGCLGGSEQYLVATPGVNIGTKM